MSDYRHRLVWENALHRQHERFWDRVMDDPGRVREWEVRFYFSNHWTKEHWRVERGAGFENAQHYVPYLFMPWRTRRAR